MPGAQIHSADLETGDTAGLSQETNPTSPSPSGRQITAHRANRGHTDRPKSFPTPEWVGRSWYTVLAETMQVFEFRLAATWMRQNRSTNF